MATVREIIKGHAEALPASPNSFTFHYGMKAYLNLGVDESKFPIVCLSELFSNDFMSLGGHKDKTYPLTILFCRKTELDATFDQLDPILEAMRISADQFIDRLTNDTANIREVNRNYKVTDVINLFNVNASGVMLEIKVKFVNNNSNCA